jgi:hypothetical protein
VTPYHGDYLQHADLAEAAKRRSSAATPIDSVPAGLRIETIRLADLTEGPVPGGGGSEPPWVKEGWFHAYRLLGATLAPDPARRQAADDLARRLMRGDHADPVERLNLERGLLRRLVEGCERVVVGYLVRRDAYSADFSAGVENVGVDAHAGLASPIFVRTAKLKDFPWNGWLTLGVPAAPTAAWNPVAGFTDPTGRLVWWALGDPAFFPAPRSTSWIGNRVTLASTARVSEAPRDALLPESGTGVLREVGRPDRSAGLRIVYRVLASAFHDGTPMTLADTLYGLSFAYRWGAPGGPQHDPVVERETERLRAWLAGLRPIRVDALEREFGEVKFTTWVQTFEVYSRHALVDPLQTASVTAPWSPVPWTVLALAEKAVEAGIAAFSADEARRLGVPWLDLVRDRRVKDLLAPMVDEFARVGYVPRPLAAHVTVADAKGKWAALRAFYAKHGHFLVTSGPYRLASWSDTAVVLDVFRDFSYPLGVGSYDRYAIPLRAYVARAETRGDRLEIHAELDVIQKFQREHRLVRESLAAQATPLDVRDVPVCRWVALDADGRVLATGTAPYAGRGVFAVDLRALPRHGTMLVALYVRDNAVDVEVRALPVARP